MMALFQKHPSLHELTTTKVCLLWRKNRPCVDKECITRGLTGNFSFLLLFWPLMAFSVFHCSAWHLSSDCKFFSCFPAVKHHWTFAELFAEQMVERLGKTMSRFIMKNDLHFGLFPSKPITPFQKTWIKQLEYKLNLCSVMWFLKRQSFGYRSLALYGLCFFYV